MWKVQSQFSKPMSDGSSTDLEWNAVCVNTQAEAEAWWKCRTQGLCAVRRVHTMWNPQGEVVRVKFD